MLKFVFLIFHFVFLLLFHFSMLCNHSLSDILSCGHKLLILSDASQLDFM